MPDKEMINRYIEYLINQSEAKDLQNRSLQLKIDELTDKISILLYEKQKEGNRIEELITELRLMNAELSKSRKKIAKLEEQLKQAKAEKYGSSRRKSKDDNDEDSDVGNADRQAAEDNFDGKGEQSADQSVSDPVECRNSFATGQTFDVANRPETYKSMGIVIFFYDEGSRGRKVLTDFLGDADLKALMSDGYNAYTFLDGELERTDHLICMAHARVKFEKAYQHGEDPVAREFVDMISELYDLEDGYEMRGLSVEDIGTERQGDHTENIVQRIKRRLDEELRKDNEYRSSYMMQALNYLDHFWDGLFLYRKDGSYPMDNNLVERSVRPFTTKRKCSIHFGSDEGVEMSAVYHSIISTLKLCGKSVWNFFGDDFKCEVLGLDTYKEYLPAFSR